MKITSVKATNFRSYKTLSWQIPEFGLTLIDGENLDTGRSNMTGKTTLLDSIFWCLYGYLPKWGGPKGGQADAVIHRGEKKCHVAVEVEHNGSTFLIERERPAKFKVTQNGKPLDGKSSDLEDRLTELLGMDANQFLISVYISQDRQSSFFTMTDTDRTKLLSTIAGLDNLNAALDKAKARKSQIESASNVLIAQKEMLEKEIGTLPLEKQKYIDEGNNLHVQHEELLKEIEAKCQYLAQELEETKLKADAEIQAIKLKADEDGFDIQVKFDEAHALVVAKRIGLDSMPKIDPKFQTSVNMIKAEISQARSYNDDCWKLKQENARIRKQIADIVAQLEAPVKDEFCRECGTKLEPTNREAHMNKLIEKADQLGAMIKPESESIDLTPLEERLQAATLEYSKEVSRLEAAPSLIKSEIQGLEATMTQLRRESDMIKMKADGEIKTIEYRVSGAKKNIDDYIRQAENHKSLLEVKMKSVSDSIAAIDKREQEKRSKIAEFQNSISENLKEMDEVLDLIDLFGPKGLRTVFFDGIIERISERASQLLMLMTDDIYATRIDQSGETVKGEAKIILKPIITKGGVDVPVDDLSGGARRMVMLAYDVAVSEAVGESSVLFLDEALDGLDAQGKAEAMRLLEEVSRTRAVMIIDHTSEIRSSVQTVLRVTYKNGISRLDNQEDEQEPILEAK